MPLPGLLPALLIMIAVNIVAGPHHAKMPKLKSHPASSMTSHR
jgi:hypothetical protein